MVIRTSGTAPPPMPRLADKFTTQPDITPISRSKIEPVAGRKQHRFAADPGTQFEKSNDRSGKGQGTDQNAQIGLNIMNGLVDADQVQVSWSMKLAKPTKNCSQANQTVQNGYQFRHLGHFDFFGKNQARLSRQ